MFAINCTVTVLKALARRAYLIFIIHPPVLVGVAIAWQDLAEPAFVKLLVTGAVCCALCYVLAGVLLPIPRVARIV